MKNSMLLFLPLFILLTGFTTSTDESKIVLQKSFEVEQLKKYLERDEANQLLPLVIVTNGKISEAVNLKFEGKEVLFFNKKSQADLYEDQGFIDVKSFKIKKGISILKFNYLGKKVKIKFRKKDGEWIYQSFRIKGGGKFHKHSTIDL